MIVTRQSNYYDNGAFSVEIAAELDFAGPGAFTRVYGQDFLESDDPREIVEEAIQLRKLWINRLKERGEDAPYIPFTLSMNGFAYAKAKYEKMDKCDYCGEIVTSRNTWQSYEAFVGDYKACSEFHMELLLQDEEELMQEAAEDYLHGE